MAVFHNHLVAILSSREDIEMTKDKNVMKF